MLCQPMSPGVREHVVPVVADFQQQPLGRTLIRGLGCQLDFSSIPYVFWLCGDLGQLLGLGTGF